MKKIATTFLAMGLLLFTGIHAQSLQDGVNDLYAERNKSAQATFEKLLAANPNNIEATYWLGQTHLATDNIAAAREVYSKALLASANAPLVIVGMGHVELSEKKVEEARQRFEAAITMSRGKKGDDPEILTAVGRAIVDVYNDKDKIGDINYAVEKLEAAAARDPKNADIFLNLGNAYRKARPGEGGGKAFESYKRANEVNPNFAAPSYRLAQLFNTQKNWDLFEQYLNEAITKDPKFAPAYYDLYYLKLGKLDFAAAEDYAKKYIANSDPDVQNDYLRVQTLWAKKSFDEAIAGAKDIIAKAGPQTKARVYKLIADSYVQKKDTASAKQYIDEYFAKVKPEEVTALDYDLKATVYSAIPGQEDVVLASYQEGVKADTVVDNKIDLIKRGIAFFNSRKQYDKEKQLQELLLQTKPNLTINDLFGAGIANYRAKDYPRSREIFTTVAEKYPEQEFGWEWKFNNAQLIDTVKKDSIALQDATALLEFAQKDTAKFYKQIVNSSYFIAIYHNEKGDREKAVEYLKIMKDATKDPVKAASIQENIDLLSKPAPRQQQSTPRSNAPKTGNSKATNAKTSTEKATG